MKIASASEGAVYRKEISCRVSYGAGVAVGITVGGLGVCVDFGVALLITLTILAVEVGEAISFVVQADNKRKRITKRAMPNFKRKAYLVISLSTFCASHASMRWLPLIKKPS